MKIYFIGLLANTNSSILNVKLDFNFKIESIIDDEGIKFFSILEDLPSYEVYKNLILHYRCVNTSEKRFYFVSNTFEADIENVKNDDIASAIFSGTGKFDLEYVHGYLNNIIRLMRLFKKGNICMPLKYYYSIDNNIPRRLTAGKTDLYISPDRYTLEDSEMPSLQRFIQKMTLPFKEPFLQLSFENFELSYETPRANLSFLSLMVSLETLFNPGGSELTYRISRNVAVLLGNNMDHSDLIFKDVQKLYGKRSGLVHKGKSNIKEEDLLRLRNYVRESIKKIDDMHKNKDDLLKLLNSCGFGQMHQMREPG